MKTFSSSLVLFLVLVSNHCFSQTYQLTDLGVFVGTNSYAQGINNQSQVVGYWETLAGAHAFLYEAGTVTDLGLLGVVATNSYALSINDQGQVVGFAETTKGSSAILYQDGVSTNLGTWSGSDSYAYGISGDSHIVGCVVTPNGTLASLYYNDNVIWLGTLGGTNSMAFGINDALQVVGSSLTTNNTTTHAFLWQDGSMIDLNQLLPWNSEWELVEARGINESGQIVGWGLINNQERAFFYKSGSATDLGVLSGGSNSFALGLNNSNSVVGTASSASGTHAFLWQSGFLNDLNDLINPGSGWELREAWGINDFGQIVGWGVLDGQAHAFLLTRTPNNPPIVTRIVVPQTSASNPMFMQTLGAPSGIPPTVSITSPTNNASFTTPTNLVISATASNYDGTAPQVQFFAWRQLLGTVTSAPYTLTWSNAPVGTFALTAVATDDYGLTATSSVVNIGVGTNLFAIADSFVRDGSYTNTNFGTNTILEIQTNSTPGTNRDAYFKFSLGSITNITSVKLSVFASLVPGATNTVTNAVYSVTNTGWGENTITWSNKPARVTALATNVVSGTNGSWYLFDVTSYVKSQQTNGQAVVSLALHDTLNTAWLMNINSRENASNNPALIVVTTNAPPCVSITSPATNSAFITPTNITITATASDGDGTSPQVQFFAWGKLLGMVTNAPYSVTWSNAPVGAFSLTAVATDDYGFISTSSVVNISVGTNLVAIADSFVRDGSYTNTNFGTNTILEVQTNSTPGTNRDAYFTFDLGVTTNNISSVKLSVFASLIPGATNTVTNTVYSVTNTSWGEYTITWSNKPARVTALATNVVSGTNGSWYLFDVTSYVKPRLTNGQTVVSLALHDLLSTAWLMNINSRENASNNPALIVVTTNAPPSVSITTPVNNSLIALPTNINITVNTSDCDGSAPLVKFFQGATLLGIMTNPPYTLTWSNVTSGTYTLTAVAIDDYGLVTTSAVVNITADLPPSVTLTNPLNNAVFRAVTNISLAAIAADADGTVTQVQFFQGSISLKTNTTAPYSMIWSNVTAGIYALTATATDNKGMISTSAVVNITVDQPPTVSISSPTNNALFATPANITINASASDSDGTVAQVQFYVGARLLGAVSGSSYSLTWSNVPSGIFPLSAVAFDNFGITSTSSVVNVNVGTNLLAIADSFVRDGSYTNSNFGTNTILEVQTNSTPGTNRDAYFKFDLGGATNNISSVKLSVFASLIPGATNSVTNTVYSVTNTGWGETTITWSNKPVRVTALATNIVSVTNGSWYLFDVTGYIKSQATNGQSVVSLALHDLLNTMWLMNINSRENASNNPSLTVVTTNLLSPSVSITNPVNNAVATEPASILVGATASDIGGINQVQFFQGNTSLGIVTNPPYNIVWSNVMAGSYALTAVAIDNYGLVSTSSVVNVKIVPLFSSNNVCLWLKADAITGLTNNAPVATWPDSSGWTNNATQTTVSYQPCYVTNVINSYPLLRFNGTNSYFNLPSVLSGTGAEGFVVLRSTNWPGGLWRMGHSGDGSLAYPNSSGQIVDDFGSQSSYNLGVPYQSLSQYHIYEVSGQNRNWAAWINGVLLCQTTNNTFSTWGVSHLGYDYNHYLAGDIAEVLVFNRTLLPSERITVNGYLNGKYALVPAVPAQPTNLVATAVSPTQIGLTWDETLNGGATQISIERSTTSNGMFSVVAQMANSLAYVDTNLTAGTTYYYQVRAINVTQWSAYSAIAFATTPVSGTNMPLGNLALWLRADAGTAEGGTNTPVGLWADQSGGGNNAVQPTGANQPVWMPGLIGDRPVIRFNGTNSYFNLPNVLTGTGAEGFAVLRSTNKPGGLWRMGHSSSGSLAYPNSSGQIVDDFGSQSSYNLGVPFLPLSQYHIYEVSGQSGNWAAWINGVLLYQTSINTFGTFGATHLGYDYNNYLAGDIAEVLVFNRPLADSERAAVNGYLNVKYGLVPSQPTNLVATAVSATQIELTWDEVLNGGATQVSIERSMTSNGVFTAVAQIPNANSYVDTNLTAGTTYYYRVRTIATVQWSGYSGVAQATTFNSGANLPVANLLLWLEAGVGLTHGNTNVPVNVWADQSGHGNNAQQPNVINQPVWVPGVIGGCPVVRFNGTNSYLNLAANTMTGTTGAEAFVVLKVMTNLPSTPQSLWYMGQFNGAAEFYPYTNGMIFETFGSAGGYAYNLGVPSQPLTQYHVYQVSAQNNNWAAWINGMIQYQTANNPYTYNSTAPALGSSIYYNCAYYFAGDVAEVMVFNRPLTADERDAAGVYLNQKYGFINLPAVPSGLSAYALSTNQIYLSWTNTPGTSTTVYLVERKTGVGGAYSQIAAVRDGNSYLDTNALAATLYYYRVRAWNYAGTSGYSAEISVTTPSAGVSLPLGDLRLWLRADAGVIPQNTNVFMWLDQSGNTNNATTYSSPGLQPVPVGNVLNGYPVVRFTGREFFYLPNVMAGCNRGEAYVVLRALSRNPPGWYQLWNFGPPGSEYPAGSSGQIGDSFGNTDYINMGVPLQDISQFHLYNPSSQVGQWNAWINGQLFCSTNDDTVAFSSSPTIGINSPGSFAGDIAEIMVFDRLLTPQEKDAVGVYLNDKYAFMTALPPTPGALLATGISPNEINLTWTNPVVTNGLVFTIERKTGVNGAYASIGTVRDVNSYLDTTVLPGTNYFYRVKSWNFNGTSAYSSEISPPMAVITNLAPQSVFSVGTNLTVSSAATDLDGTVTQVTFWVNGILVLTDTSAPYSGILTNLSAGTYQVMAQAMDNQGNSSFSAPVTVIVSPDTDGDGINDFTEILNGTDPTNPNDPGQWTPPSTSTAPTITLTEPAGAILLP